MRPDQPNDNTELRLPFGLREGRMWAPREVASGLACDCTYPACGSPLESRNKGSKHKAYFAHHSGNTCHGAYESAIYRMAQQLICDRLRLTLPAWNGAEGMPNPPTATDSRGSRLLGKRVYYPSRSVQLRTAKTEPNIADYRPDVLAEDNEGELLIEIRVSDVVDDRKGRSLPPDGRRMMEIDLSGLPLSSQVQCGACFLLDAHVTSQCLPSSSERPMTWRSSFTGSGSEKLMKASPSSVSPMA